MRSVLLMLLAAVVTLQVSSEVAALQCDLETTGTAQIAAGLTTKQLTSNRLPNGKLRLIIYGLNQSTFSGAFATVDAVVQSVSGVVLSTPTGAVAAGTISILDVPIPQLPAPRNVIVK